MSLESSATLSARHGILTVTIKDKAALYAAYMPFVSGGGLFIPTTKKYQLDDEVFMVLSLMDDVDKLALAGRVVWLTPKGAQGNRTTGVGVQFNDQGGQMARDKIEGYLAGLLGSDKPTHTF